MLYIFTPLLGKISHFDSYFFRWVGATTTDQQDNVPDDLPEPDPKGALRDRWLKCGILFVFFFMLKMNRKAMWLFVSCCICCI